MSSCYLPWILDRAEHGSDLGQIIQLPAMEQIAVKEESIPRFHFNIHMLKHCLGHFKSLGTFTNDVTHASKGGG